MGQTTPNVDCDALKACKLTLWRWGGAGGGLTCENGDRSGLVPEAMVASLHTMRNETTPRQQAMPRVTQGCAVHLRQQHRLTDADTAVLRILKQ